MSTTRWIRCRWVPGLVALAFCVVPARMLAGQGSVPGKEQADDVAAFKEFSARVQEYVKLHRTVKSSLPALKSTDEPEMITAHQQALARRIREARPHAKPGDLFTSAALDAFRRAAAAQIGGTGSGAVKSRAYMHPGEADPLMRLEVNHVYPEGEPITALSPELLAAFPPLPAEVAYRVIGRSLILIDVKSRLIVDFARGVLPPSA